MHIKSKFEINFVHIAVLAVCPFMAMLVSFNTGMMIMSLSILSYLLSTLACLLFFKKSSKNVRIFVSAFISALIVVGYEFLVSQNILETLGSAAYFSILSAMVLSIDNNSHESNLSTLSYVLKIVRLLIVYSIVATIYFLLKELLSFGTISGQQFLENFEGYEFFKYITFDLLLLGLLCAIINRIAMLFIELYNDKKMVYNKYKTKIRNEKQFLYDNLRRKKLLTSDIEINHINDEKTIEGDDGESALNDEKFDEINSQEQEIKKAEKSDEKSDKKPNKKKQKIKKSHLKVSKEAKIEKVFDRASDRKEGEDNA